MEYYSSSASVAAGSAGTLYSIVSLLMCIASLVGMWKMFEKGGEDGWKALIPFYSTWILCKLVLGSGAKMFLFLIPLFNIVYAIMFCFREAKAYGQSTAFGFGLLLLGPVFQCILGFGDAKYVGPQC